MKNVPNKPKMERFVPTCITFWGNIISRVVVPIFKVNKMEPQEWAKIEKLQAKEKELVRKVIKVRAEIDNLITQDRLKARVESGTQAP